MSSKLSVAPTVRAHFDTFRDDRNGKIHRPDWALFVGVPAVLGLLSALFRLRLQDLSGYLGGLAVFTALLFGLVIFVFQLRLQLASREEDRRRVILIALVDQLFYNVNYAVVVGVLTTSVGVMAVSLTSDSSTWRMWLSTALVVLAAHLVMTILMCVKRIHSAYAQLAR